MLMYDEAKEIYECEECCRSLGRKALAIKYGDKYLCKSCYNRKITALPNAIPSCDKVSEQEFENLLKHIHKGKFFREYHKFSKGEKIHMTPREIVAYLDKNIIGQDAAKKALAVAVCNHYRRINADEKDITIPKSNVLIEGPTGCGKTYILKTLAELLEVPFFVADASIITEAGYKGNDVEAVVTGLYQAAGEDIEKTQKGIIYLDEFDKLSSRYGYSSGDSSVGAGVQRQMLKMIEGCVMDIPKSGYRKSGDSVTINTENILFICGGAFVGLHKEKKAKSTQSIGFMSDGKARDNDMKKTDKLCPEDFINFGLIPEMVGRLPIIVSLTDLTEADLVNVLRNTERSLIKRYCALFKSAYDVELVFYDDAITEIAHQAHVRKTGARGLNAIVENIMQELLFDIPSEPSIRKCIITKEVVQGIDKPHVVKENDIVKRNAS